MSEITDKAAELLREPGRPNGPFHCPGCNSVHLAIDWEIEGSLTIIYTDDGNGEANEEWDDDPDVHTTYPFALVCLDCDGWFEFESNPPQWRKITGEEI